MPMTIYKPGKTWRSAKDGRAEVAPGEALERVRERGEAA